MAARACGGKYFGGKNGDGVYQRIINLIPPHDIWIEGCTGSAAITRRIRAAVQSFCYEIDPVQAKKLRAELQARAVVIEGDIMEVELAASADIVNTFIYIDPPYMKSVRSCSRDMYAVEWVEEDHRRFLEWVRNIECMVMITHPVCDIYLAALKDWERVEYKYMSRNGLRSDCIWMNYATPAALHDYRYIGKDRIERQTIGRRRERLLDKIATLPALERNAILAALDLEYGCTGL